MNVSGKTAWQKMDSLVRWSGVSDRVKRDMSNELETGRRHRPMRWVPLIPMACGAGLILAAATTPMSPVMYAAVGPLIATMAAISLNGPLGKPSIEDDEREAALRKDAFLFCFAILAFANMVGGPVLMLMAALHAWTTERIAGVAFALVVGNMAWLGALPTLYASWKSPRSSSSED
ncbi:hypothetical protein LQ564_02075 [Massilia sp. G4R7]|uniref:Uncharacterized protein n=1 Tax=Massilia phyllostachyos TaxID=2898585 RepID=A0ABS8Q017_9BURK|nr:hypothetical protein [Massilia phyllostachyos]MCD2515097.1 hypothetical protein [Massilia phyllostachyos]